jgi:uncharacterized ion transporter superfamily protein YfcC
MAEEKKKDRNKIKDVAFRVVKASVKAILVYLLYFFVAPLVSPLFGLIPGFMETVEMFVTVYIVLMILSDLTAHTIFQYFFNTARALFVIAYLILQLGSGVISMDVENFSLTLNLTTFYTIAALLSLLGFAKSVLQAINFLNERAESGTHP